MIRRSLDSEGQMGCTAQAASRQILSSAICPTGRAGNNSVFCYIFGSAQPGSKVRFQKPCAGQAAPSHAWRLDWEGPVRNAFAPFLQRLTGCKGLPKRSTEALQVPRLGKPMNHTMTIRTEDREIRLRITANSISL